MSWIIKIAKPGFDAKTAADKDLVFSSELNTFKVAAVGNTSTTYTHGLGYTPAFFESMDFGGGKWGMVGQFYLGMCFATSTVFNGDGDNFKYYLFHQQT